MKFLCPGPKDKVITHCTLERAPQDLDVLLQQCSMRKKLKSKHFLANVIALCNRSRTKSVKKATVNKNAGMQDDINASKYAVPHSNPFWSQNQGRQPWNCFTTRVCIEHHLLRLAESLSSTASTLHHIPLSQTGTRLSQSTIFVTSGNLINLADK